MTVAYQSSTTITPGTGNTVVLNKPASTASGDFLIAGIVMRSTSVTISGLPSGWTQLEKLTVGTNGSAFICYLKAGGSEPASYTFTLSASVTRNAAMVRIDGQDPEFAFSGSKGSSSNWNSVSTSGGAAEISISGGVTPTTANPLLVMWGFNASDNNGYSAYQVANNNPSWTERIDSGGSFTNVSFADGSYASGSGTGDAQATGTIGEEKLLFILAINPVSSVKHFQLLGIGS